jgi:SAM-dependent methyltransferase
MARTVAFAANADRYDRWFSRHDAEYVSELMAVRHILPNHSRGIEIGVGTGRFAAPLGIQIGLDPCREMLAKARDRNLAVVAGTAEALPFADQTFDLGLLVTTICFVDSVEATFHEIYRILRPKGHIVVGLVDRDSPLGREYVERQADSVFNRDATFYSAADIESLLTATGFRNPVWVQTLFEPHATTAIKQAQPGHGSGSFVVVRAIRSS